MPQETFKVGDMVRHKRYHKTGKIVRLFPDPQDDYPRVIAEILPEVHEQGDGSTVLCGLDNLELPLSVLGVPGYETYLWP